MINHAAVALKEKLEGGRPTFGVNIYSAAVAAVEIAANWGLDFAFIDAEHTAVGIDQQMEKLLLAARAAQIAALVRVRGTIEPDIRKALELGATGVIIPQVHSGEQMRAIIRAAKFPPLGRRGGDSSVSSASFGGQGFDWAKYATDANRNSLIIPMAESFEFFDNIDDILMVEGIDVVHFGPADYSLSRGIPVDYSMRHPEVQERLLFLIDKCHAKGIKVMVPCAPAEESSARQLIEMGCDMLIVGNDVHFLNAGCRSAAEVAKSAI